MSGHTRDAAEAFSSHRFREVYDRLAADVVWVAVGYGTTVGRDAVVAVCEETMADLATQTTEYSRFVAVADDRTAVVDAIGHYTDPDGTTSTVSSCDIYEFRDDVVVRITSYTVELDPGAGSPAQI